MICLRNKYKHIEGVRKEEKEGEVCERERDIDCQRKKEGSEKRNGKSCYKRKLGILNTRDVNLLRRTVKRCRISFSCVDVIIIIIVTLCCE